MIQAAALGGVFIGVLSALPIINIANCCCVWIMSGGALAAWLGGQDAPENRTLGRGALLGLLAGIIGALVWLPCAVAVGALLAPLREQLMAGIVSGSVNVPPEVRSALELLGRDGGAILGYVLEFLVQLFAGMVFATLGGLLAALFISRRDAPPALGGPPVVPPPIPPQL